jgi:hypothetical protein
MAHIASTTGRLANTRHKLHIFPSNTHQMNAIRKDFVRWMTW